MAHFFMASDDLRRVQECSPPLPCGSPRSTSACSPCWRRCRRSVRRTTGSPQARSASNSCDGDARPVPIQAPDRPCCGSAPSSGYASTAWSRSSWAAPSKAWASTANCCSPPNSRPSPVTASRPTRRPAHSTQRITITKQAQSPTRRADHPVMRCQHLRSFGPACTPDRRVGARSLGERSSLNVTLSIGITLRPTSDPAPIGLVCWRPMGRWSGSCRGSIQRRPGHIMLELARDMRQSERSPRVAAMHNCADHGLRRWRAN